MVDCENRIRLGAYHDGELSPGERLHVEAHLNECASCAAGLAAMRSVSATFAAAPPREPTHEQLLHLAQCARAQASDARALLRLFRTVAIAAALLLACSMVAAVYLSQRTKAAAHEAMVLDQMATGSQPPAFAIDAASEGRQSEQRVLLAQWIAYDLRGPQEER